MDAPTSIKPAFDYPIGADPAMPKQAINPAMRDGLPEDLPSKQVLVSPWRMLRSGVIQRLAPRSIAASAMRVATSRKPVVLIYHDVPSVADNHSVDLRTFESHITFMKRHFDFITPQQLNERRHTLSRIRVLLTFDDGFRNQFELAKRVLLNHSVPALFFIPRGIPRPELTSGSPMSACWRGIFRER